MESMARSMGNAIRAGSDNSLVQSGKSGTTKTYYQISWPWISLHCMVEIAGASFIVLTILRTRRVQAPIWKSSALAVLSRGPYIREKLEGANSLSSLGERAAVEYARLLGQQDVGQERYKPRIRKIERSRSLLSGLARVRRNVLLIDSGEYRNAQTRHIHDLLGFDGVTAAYHRHAARQQLRHYSTVSWTNGTVTSITPTGNSSHTSFRVSSADANNRTQGGSGGDAYDDGADAGSLPTVPECDRFRRSSVGADMGVAWYGGRLYADQSDGLVTNVPGVYAVDDANTYNSTNLPHALWSGKRAAVGLHGDSGPPGSGRDV
ncbi:hypothetical protein SLS58_009514 [Diplodia intermedia]|uniref:Uncharacterized protein n=1 Tax=Diplodia intermedia TaxID=856260 RepID=A0ABR3TBP8_9PEZI